MLPLTFDVLFLHIFVLQELRIAKIQNQIKLIDINATIEQTLRKIRPDGANHIKNNLG